MNFLRTKELACLLNPTRKSAQSQSSEMFGHKDELPLDDTCSHICTEDLDELSFMTPCSSLSGTQDENNYHPSPAQLFFTPKSVEVTFPLFPLADNSNSSMEFNRKPLETLLRHSSRSPNRERSGYGKATWKNDPVTPEGLKPRRSIDELRAKLRLPISCFQGSNHRSKTGQSMDAQKSKNKLRNKYSCLVSESISDNSTYHTPIASSPHLRKGAAKTAVGALVANKIFGKMSKPQKKSNEKEPLTAVGILAAQISHQHHPKHENTNNTNRKKISRLDQVEHSDIDALIKSERNKYPPTSFVQNDSSIISDEMDQVPIMKGETDSTSSYHEEWENKYFWKQYENYTYEQNEIKGDESINNSINISKLDRMEQSGIDADNEPERNKYPPTSFVQNDSSIISDETDQVPIMNDKSDSTSSYREECKNKNASPSSELLMWKQYEIYTNQQDEIERDNQKRNITKFETYPNLKSFHNSPSSSRYEEFPSYDERSIYDFSPLMNDQGCTMERLKYKKPSLFNCDKHETLDNNQILKKIDNIIIKANDGTSMSDLSYNTDCNFSPNWKQKESLSRQAKRFTLKHRSSCFDETDIDIKKRMKRNQRHAKQQLLLGLVRRLQNNPDLIADLDLKNNDHSSFSQEVSSFLGSDPFPVTPMDKEGLIAGYSKENQDKVLSNLRSILLRMEEGSKALSDESLSKTFDHTDELFCSIQFVSMVVETATVMKKNCGWEPEKWLRKEIGLDDDESDDVKSKLNSSLDSRVCSSCTTQSISKDGSTQHGVFSGKVLFQTIEVVAALLQKITLALEKCYSHNSIHATEEIKRHYLQLMNISSLNLRILNDAFYMNETIIQTNTPTQEATLAKQHVSKVNNNSQTDYEGRMERHSQFYHEEVRIENKKYDDKSPTSLQNLLNDSAKPKKYDHEVTIDSEVDSKYDNLMGAARTPWNSSKISLSCDQESYADSKSLGTVNSKSSSPLPVSNIEFFSDLCSDEPGK